MFVLVSKILDELIQIFTSVNEWSFGIPTRFPISGQKLFLRTVDVEGNLKSRRHKRCLTVTQHSGQTLVELGIFFDPATGRPLVIDPRLIGPDGRANPEFFGHPAPGTVGTLHLTPVSGPGFWNFDFSMIKRSRISERTNIEFRAEFFNVFNHTNFFTGENQTITSATFGRVTDTFDPRIIQFAVKFNF